MGYDFNPRNSASKLKTVGTLIRPRVSVNRLVEMDGGTPNDLKLIVRENPGST